MGRLNIVTMAKPPKLNYRYNAISIKISLKIYRKKSYS